MCNCGVRVSITDWKLPYNYSKLTFRFKLFKDEKCVGEIEKVAEPKFVGDGQFDYYVEIGGVAFDRYLLKIYDIFGNLIHETARLFLVGDFQVMIYKFSIKVVNNEV
jgi:hypothetical protein